MSTTSGPADSAALLSSDSQEFWIAGIDTNNDAFLQRWNRSTWLRAEPVYSNESEIRHLEMLPRVNEGPQNDLVEEELVLLLLGDIHLPTGRALAVLFDGINFVPYMHTTRSSGEPGIISSMFWDYTSDYFDPFHEKGYVVGIAAGVVTVLFAIIAVGELENWVHGKLQNKKRFCEGSKKSKEADADSRLL